MKKTGSPSGKPVGGLSLRHRETEKRRTCRGACRTVIMSLEDYEALEETAYLLRSPKNAKRLLESIAQLEHGKGHEKELIE
ncbi:type II toxin-antitoxin system Phd/YefM family antitoxin [Desulfatiferula olefinivorans]